MSQEFDIQQMVITMAVSQGDPGAMVAYTSLCQREDKMILTSIIGATQFIGEPLRLLWKEVFSEDTARTADAFRGQSHNRLCEIRKMLEKPPLGIQEARLALGVDSL